MPAPEVVHFTPLPPCARRLAPDLCGGSPALLVLVFTALRLLQGAGAALVMTCIFADLSDAFPTRKGAVLGMAAATASAGH